MSDVAAKALAPTLPHAWKPNRASIPRPAIGPAMTDASGSEHHHEVLKRASCIVALTTWHVAAREKALIGKDFVQYIRPTASLQEKYLTGNQLSVESEILQCSISPVF